MSPFLPRYLSPLVIGDGNLRPRERFKEQFQRFRRDARPVISHDVLRSLFTQCQGNFDRSPFRGVLPSLSARAMFLSLLVKNQQPAYIYLSGENLVHTQISQKRG